MQETKVELRSLDTTLGLFDPSRVPDTFEPKVWRPKADWAKRGELSQAVLDMLRLATTPMSTRDMAIVYMRNRGMDVDGTRLVQLPSKRLGCCLRGKPDQGLVASAPGPGQVMVWRIAA